MITYDSSIPSKIWRDAFLALWHNRYVIVVLVKRDISIRYKRSLLGLLWTLLNPLLTSLVLWYVFITAFSSRLSAGTQFATYLLSGVLMITFFTQGFNQSADSIAQNNGILMKIYVPPQIFAFASSISNAINFLFGLGALAFLSFYTGEGVSIKFPLTVILVLCMLMLVTGLGLITSILYIRFDDTRSIFAILMSFMVYLTPVFYPKEILDDFMIKFVNANPLTSFLEIFRFVFCNDGVATLNDWAYMGLSSTLIFIIGIKIFVKTWPETAVML